MQGCAAVCERTREQAWPRGLGERELLECSPASEMAVELVERDGKAMTWARFRLIEKTRAAELSTENSPTIACD